MWVWINDCICVPSCLSCSQQLCTSTVSASVKPPVQFKGHVHYRCGQNVTASCLLLKCQWKTSPGTAVVSCNGTELAHGLSGNKIKALEAHRKWTCFNLQDIFSVDSVGECVTVWQQKCSTVGNADFTLSFRCLRQQLDMKRFKFYWQRACKIYEAGWQNGGVDRRQEFRMQFMFIYYRMADSVFILEKINKLILDLV